MADYDSALPVRGNVTDGASEYAENTVLIIGGGDGSNYQQLLMDSSGRPNIVGAAADGAGVTGNPVLIAGSDGVNAETILTDNNGQIELAHDINTNPVFTTLTHQTT